MDQKDVDGIANAVTRELAKLNRDKEPQATEPQATEPEVSDETFICPECGNPVKANMPFCPGCGCELEWGE